MLLKKTPHKSQPLDADLDGTSVIYMTYVMTMGSGYFVGEESFSSFSPSDYLTYVI